jgi:hypothetical protein
MAKKTGLKNITDADDIENETGLNSKTDQTAKQPPKRRSRSRKKAETPPLPVPLPEAADETPAVSAAEETAPSDILPLSEVLAAGLPVEDFTLGDFISEETILKLEPVIEKEPESKKKTALGRGRRRKSASNTVLKSKPVLKKEPVEEPIEDKTSEEFPANTEPVIETELDISASSKELQDIKQEPVIFTIPINDEDLKGFPEGKSIPVIKEEPIAETAAGAPSAGVSSPGAFPSEEQDAAAQPLNAQPPEKRPAKADYAAAEYSSIQAMASLKGFAPLGMLFILMDVLNGSEEGMIRVNRLAKALSIGKPAMLAQLENLEQAGLIRTTSSSQQGRHIELLIPNRVACESYREIRNPGTLSLSDALPWGASRNFSFQKLKELQNFLTEHGVQLVALPNESGLDPQIPPIAAFLGKYLSYVQPFYARLKATLNAGEGIQFPLSGAQGRDITHILNFCKMLKDAGFLAAFTYRRAPYYTVVARLARTPAAINFLSGGWLEHYIRDKVVSIVTTHPVTMDMPYAFMKNPRIILPGDEDFEFDFLLLVGSSVFWIEAKTGEYMDYLAKYSRVSKLLDLNRNSNLLVLVDAPKPDANISARYGISCCSVDEFPEVFRLAMVRELARPKRSIKI